LTAHRLLAPFLISLDQPSFIFVCNHPQHSSNVCKHVHQCQKCQPLKHANADQHCYYFFVSASILPMASLLTTHPIQPQVPLARLPQCTLKWLLICFTPYEKLNTAASDDDFSLIIIELRGEWILIGTFVCCPFFLFRCLSLIIIEQVAGSCCISWPPRGLIFL
jgi:hypothetical protein